MGNSSYRKGANFERQFIKAMSGKYLGVRSAGSHSPFDVILIPIGEHNPQNVIVCQLKAYKDRAAKATPSFKDLEVGDSVTKWWVTKLDRKELKIEVI